MKARDLKPLTWKGSSEEGALLLLDQRILPNQETWFECKVVENVASAIQNMTVRGAPAIGIAAAYGMVLAAQKAKGKIEVLQKYSDLLAASRPTAVNLFWGLKQCMDQAAIDPNPKAMLELALRLHAEDIDGNEKMGHFGARYLENGMSILTHCNAGALATGGMGTALGVIFVAHEQGKKIHVYVDETRPRLQGARLTAWELSKMGVPHTLICDNMAASLMVKGKIQACITGADRIAANGDTANKIGTYSVAVNAHFHKIPFYVAAPHSTFDLSLQDGARIPIEERASEEVSMCGLECNQDGEGIRYKEKTCPPSTVIYNPAFDVTPASLIAAIFTNVGEIKPVTRETVRARLT